MPVPEGNIEFRGEIMANDDLKCGAAAIISSPHRHNHGGVAVKKMADFEAPPGPPPPKVPEGWKAQWNDQYKEWFYVNIYTKKSQWDKPTAPVYPPD
ncbi:hypothetical protein V500_06690, partial [Pseudogymnoascus sp. VKM F-4518 (FW-2643)]